MSVGTRKGNTAAVNHSGGNVKVTSMLGIGGGSLVGEYNISGTARLDAASINIGNGGNGTMNQNWGTVNVTGTLSIDTPVGENAGAYNLNSGSLTTTNTYVGIYGYGSFIQAGGNNAISGQLRVGGYSGSDGTYVVSGGKLNAKAVLVGGLGGNGTISLSEPAEVFISDSLTLGAAATLTADEGSTIHFTGKTFQNQSINPSLLDGLENLTLIFEGTGSTFSTFELAGYDFGRDDVGFYENFELNSLRIGGTAGIGKVRLLDTIDNQPSWTGKECLYVENLVLSSGSQLDLNGYKLYYSTFTNNGGSILLNGGQLIAVPEPSLIGVLSVALAILAGRRRRGGICHS